MLKTIPLPHCSVSLSSMVLGAGAWDPAVSAADADRLYEMFRAAGGTAFDTAHCYSFWIPAGAGSSERALGALIRRHGDEGRVTIITKGGHPGVEPGYPRPDRYLAPETLASDIAESLGNLGVGRIDLYLLHRDDARVPVGEIIDALESHIVAGRLSAIGVSNWSTARIEAANAYAVSRGRHRFVISQPQFNLGCPNAAPATQDPAMRYLTAEDLAWHTRTQLPVIAYSPTANGYFATGGARGVKNYENATSRGRLARASELAARRGVTPNQVALAYVMNQPFPAMPILGTGKLSHLADALGAAEVKLRAEKMAFLAG